VYGKIFKSIYYGSLAPKRDARELMTFLCVHSDRSGWVDMTLRSCGKILDYTTEMLEGAAVELMSEDPHSSSPAEGGRRIIARDLETRGIQIVNFESYQKMQNSEDQREYNRRYYIEVTKPKLLADKDSSVLKNPQESSSRSGHVDVDVDVDRDGDKQTLPSASAKRVRRGVARASLETTEKLPEGELTSEQVFDDVFWPEYPRKRDRVAAKKAWKALHLKDTDEDTMLRIMGALRRDLKGEFAGRADDKIPYPATWLNRRPWET
jgi:hypothetical protein